MSDNNHGMQLNKPVKIDTNSLKLYAPNYFLIL